MNLLTTVLYFPRVSHKTQIHNTLLVSFMVLISDEVLPLDKECINGWSQVQLQAYRVILEYSRWENNIMPRLFMIPLSNREDVTPECALHMVTFFSHLNCYFTDIYQSLMIFIDNQYEILCNVKRQPVMLKFTILL